MQIIWFKTVNLILYTCVHFNYNKLFKGYQFTSFLHEEINSTNQQG